MRIEYLLLLYFAFYTSCGSTPVAETTDSGTLPGLVPGGDTSGYWKAKTRKVQVVDQMSWFTKLAQDTGSMWRVLAVVDVNAPKAKLWIQSLQKAAMAPGVDARATILIEAEDEFLATNLLLSSGTTLPGIYCPEERLSWEKAVDPNRLAPQGPGLWIWQQGMTEASFYPWPEEEGAWPGIIYPTGLSE